MMVEELGYMLVGLVLGNLNNLVYINSQKKKMNKKPWLLGTTH
jgi:hypothetical protein